MKTYKIVRLYFESEWERETIDTGLTLEEAQEHCSNPQRSSTTCTTLEGLDRTSERGPWFHAYYEE